jgi:heat shock protein HtpX
MAASFYGQIDSNRRNSFLLALVVFVLLGLLGFAIGFGLTGAPEGAVGTTGVAVVIAALMTTGSYFAGDRLILSVSRARPVTEDQAPQLYNVIRELTIAANVPAPKVYVIDDSAPNAFVTGRDPQHASLAVTTGLLEKLDREELQGVIAHELGHVRNLDIRFMLLVGVLVGSIALMADFFLRWMWWGGGSRSGSRRSSGGGGGGLQAIMLVLAVVLAILAPIVARLVQLAVSRQREYLADATAISLTRNPYGLERALAKISGDPEVLEAANRATQHMYFANPIKKFEKRASGLFSTHPPIVDRINRLRKLTGQPPIEASQAAVLKALEDSGTPPGLAGLFDTTGT